MMEWWLARILQSVSSSGSLSIQSTADFTPRGREDGG